MNLNKVSKRDREKNYKIDQVHHFFSRLDVIEALDDYAIKKGWKWGSWGDKKTKATVVFHPKDQTITIREIN